MGESETIELETPPIEYSQSPVGKVPYSVHNIRVERDGFQTLVINGCQVFPEQVALQACNLTESGNRMTRADVINIQSNVLNGDFPAKIPENSR